MQLISEIRNVIKPEDVDAFNEMTIGKEINARKVTLQCDVTYIKYIDDYVREITLGSHWGHKIHFLLVLKVKVFRRCFIIDW